MVSQGTHVVCQVALFHCLIPASWLFVASEAAFLPQFYHTTEQVKSAIQSLKPNCPGLSMDSVKDPNGDQTNQQASLDVVRFSHPNGAKVKTRVALVFGEHARELITVETCLHLIQKLCIGSQHAASFLNMMTRRAKGPTSGSRPMNGLKLPEESFEDVSRFFQSNVSASLHEIEFLMFPNANPISRANVENGDVCKRTNEENIDLNRDYDSHWESARLSFDSPPGLKPFSSGQTRIIAKVLADFKPKLFISFHSGFLGLFVPYAYALNAPEAALELHSLAYGIDKDFCHCPFGGASKTIGYPAPGTSLDYAFDVLKIPYSFTWEIYVGGGHWSREFEDRWKDEELEFKKRLVIDEHGKTSDSLAASDSILTSQRRCFDQFNPSDEKEYSDIKQRWSHAALALALRVVKEP